MPNKPKICLAPPPPLPVYAETMAYLLSNAIQLEKPGVVDVEVYLAISNVPIGKKLELRVQATDWLTEVRRDGKNGLVSAPAIVRLFIPSRNIRVVTFEYWFFKGEHHETSYTIKFLPEQD